MWAKESNLNSCPCLDIEEGAMKGPNPFYCHNLFAVNTLMDTLTMILLHEGRTANN
jgi:hypothetical protein